jgi:hypothetical protein
MDIESGSGDGTSIAVRPRAAKPRRKERSLVTTQDPEAGTELDSAAPAKEQEDSINFDIEDPPEATAKSDHDSNNRTGDVGAGTQGGQDKQQAQGGGGGGGG